VGRQLRQGRAVAAVGCSARPAGSTFAA
jgi:hypothetical protein